MKLEEKLDGLIAKHDELQTLLATNSGVGGEEYVRLSKEFTELDEIVKVVQKYRAVETEIHDLQLMKAKALVWLFPQQSFQYQLHKLNFEYNFV